MITKEEFENISTLARLCSSEEEYIRFAEDLSSMISFADSIREAKDTELCFLEHGESFLREDEVTASAVREEILSNAPLSQDGFFLLRKRA